MDSAPQLPPAGAGEYYNACIERLADLADWFFRGDHAYMEPHTWSEL